GMPYAFDSQQSSPKLDAPAAINSANFTVVASLCISSGNLSSLAVGSCSGSGNSSLPVGMPCAFYSQHVSSIASSRFPSTNNQLRTSLNPRNQATIQDSRVIVQHVQGREGTSYSGTGFKSNVTRSEGNNASRHARIVECYNYQAFQTKDLDTYDSDYDDISNAQAVLMANISNYGSDVISEVPHFETYLNDMKNQSVHAMQDFEQTPAVDVSDNEIHSDSNIIPYS
nr:hypothetical protein [Tanacetum cinerariifolium]